MKAKSKKYANYTLLYLKAENKVFTDDAAGIQ